MPALKGEHMRAIVSCLLAALLILLFPALSAMAEPRSSQPPPRITQLSGRAEIREAASRQWRPAQSGDALSPGTAVRTTGGGQATIADEATSVVLKRDSQLQYEGGPSASSDASSGWLGGSSGGSSGSTPGPEALRVYSLPSGTADVTITPGTSLDLITPLILTSVRGTRFTATVSGDGSSSIRVRNGRVSVSDKLGRSRSLGAGQSHTLTAMEYIKGLRATPRHAKEPPPPPDLGRGGDGGASGGGSSGGGGGGDGGDD